MRESLCTGDIRHCQMGCLRCLGVIAMTSILAW